MRRRLSDIAKQLNVSVATVSRALNPEKNHLISAEVKSSVLDMAEKLKVIPNRAGRAFISSAHTIGFIFPADLRSMFFYEYIPKILAGVFDVLKNNPKYKCNILIVPTDKNLPDLELKSLTDNLDGLFISCYCSRFTWNANYMPHKLGSFWKKPVVYLNPEIKRIQNYSYTTLSNFEAAKKAVGYLIKKGHKKIAFFYGHPDIEEIELRYKGYCQAMKDHQLPVLKTLLKRGHFNEEDGYRAAMDLLQGNNKHRPTAVFCTSDEMAIGVINALDKLKIHCPKEMAVMGFDGLSIGKYIRPRLTTVAQPFTETAQSGMKILIDLIEKKVKSPQVKILPSPLIIRDSA